MARRCKGERAPFPTFAAENGGRKKFSRRWEQGKGEVGRSQVLFLQVLFPLFLQLPLQRLDLFGQRGIPGHQCLDLAHGVQHRGVVASAEPAADLGQ
jgi:hypothetical protein